MFVPSQGSLRRTHYDGVELRAGISETEYSINAKIGYVQVSKIIKLFNNY